MNAHDLALAKMVVEHCAKVCKSIQPMRRPQNYGEICRRCATAIRALDLTSLPVERLPEDRDALDALEIYKAIQRGAGDLPDGYEVEITVERGSACVVLRDPDGNLQSIDVDSDNRLAAEINAATDAAIAKEPK